MSPLQEESGCEEDEGEDEEEGREEEEEAGFDSDESLVDSDSDSDEKGVFGIEIKEEISHEASDCLLFVDFILIHFIDKLNIFTLFFGIDNNSRMLFRLFHSQPTSRPTWRT